MISEVNAPPLVLATKLSLPQSPVRMVRRERLNEKMSRSLQCKLSIVIAPPGFGKSISVSDWLRNTSDPVRTGWLSLDKGENDPHRFWSYVIASLEKHFPGIGHKALSLLQSTIAVSIEHMIILFINDLYDLKEQVVLVLDDYHLIESEEVHRSLLFFLERMPDQVCLCIISRSTPPLPLGVFRAKGQLNELDIDDLKFNKEEISSFWLEHMRMPLTEQQIAQLADRTEGWIAGIQLASIASSGNLDHTLSHFSGNHRFIVDYLMEDVIQHLPEDIRRFLFQTAILERMNDDLCASVTGIAKERQLLAYIEQANIFLIRLDNDNRWYRYHHLFLDFLRSRYEQEIEEDKRILHHRASAWYEEHSFIEEAIEHALLAEEFDKAAEFVQSHAAQMFKKRELATLSRWFEGMPVSITQHPALLIIQAYTEMMTGRYDHARKHITSLEQAAEALQTDPDSLTAVRLREEAYICLSFHAWLQRDYETIYSRINEVYERDAVPGNEVVQQLLQDVIHLNDGRVPLISGFYGFDGKLKQATSFHQLYENFIRKHHLEQWHFVAYPHTAMSEIYYEKNELDLALKYADDAIASAELHGSLGAYVPSVIVKARVHRAWSRPKREMDVIASAMNRIQQKGEQQSYWYDLLQAYYVRCSLASGAVEVAEAWLTNSNISDEENAAIHQEFEITTLIRILIAKGEYHEALNWAERMLGAAKEKNLIMTVLNSYLLLAVIFDGLNETYSSMLHLHQALTLGEEEGYLRTLIDMEEISNDLLGKYVSLRKNNYIPEIQMGVSMIYVKKLLSLVHSETGKKEIAIEATGDITSEYELTGREIEVLKCVCVGLSNKEISEQLVLTVGTVKLHLNRIYSKLGVRGRVQAIQKARHLQ